MTNQISKDKMQKWIAAIAKAIQNPKMVEGDELESAFISVIKERLMERGGINEKER